MNQSNADKNQNPAKPKYNPFAMVRPRKTKEVIIFILMVVVVLSGISPFIKVVNLPVLILGMPAIMFMSILNAICVIVVLIIAYKWEVN